MRYLPVPYYQQDRDFTCGPTSLQMVLSYYGIRFSEAHLAHELHTNKQIGTMHKGLIDAARKHGLFCYVNNNSTFEEMDYLVSLSIPPIIHYLEQESNEDHYSVVIGTTEKDVVLNDPWNGERVHVPKKDFSHRWTCDLVGNCTNWLLALSPTEIPIGHEYRPVVLKKETIL